MRKLLAGVLIFSLFFLIVAADSGPVWPEAGTSISQDGSLIVDDSHSADGYILVRSEKSKKKLKLRVSANGQNMDYELNLDGSAEVFPLQMGDGEYTVTLYKNAQGKNFSQDGRVFITVALNNPFAAELVPNQQVNYTADSAAVRASMEVCAGLATEKARYDAICDYIAKNMAYDFIKAVTVKPGTLPDIEGCFAARSGIYNDLSAITVCMLRVQGIPARLVTGKIDKGQQHAWVTAYVDGDWQFFDPSVAVNGLTTPKSYTAEKYF